MLAPLLENLKAGRRTRPDALLGDKAYSSKANRSLLRSRKIEAVISEPTDQQGHRLRRGSKGGRPPKFNAIKYKHRNVIERGYARMKQWRGLATRYDKLAIIYRAGVPRKLWTREPHHAACVDASSPIWPTLCSAKNFSSNSTGGTIPNAECNRRRL